MRTKGHGIKKHGVRVVGASLLMAIGLAVLAATAAQAGEFTIEGSTFTSKGLSSESFSGTIAEGELLIPGLELTTNCTSGVISGTALLGGTGHFTVLFSGCTKLGNKFCKIFETKANMEANIEPGFIVASGLGELILMGTKHYFLASSGAAPFTTIYLTKQSLGCVLPLEEVISGSTVFALPTALTALVSQTVSTLSQSELEALFPSDVLRFGNQTAWLDKGGSTNLALSGAKKGAKWGGE